MDPDADALYGLPVEEFTAARDALAARLRADGRREEAAAVRALRRPTVAAAALNRAARTHPEARDELLAAGRNLARAQERLVTGEGDRSVLREAAEHVREAISALASLATAQAGLSTASAERVRATLQTALVDDEVRAALARGRLDREAEAGAGGFGTFGAGSAPGKRRGTSPRRAEPASSGPAPGVRDDRRAQASERLRAASTAARELERQLERATRRADRTAATVEDLRGRLEAAEAEAQAAAAEADALRRRLRDAKAEAAAAQAAVEDSP